MPLHQGVVHILGDLLEKVVYHTSLLLTYLVVLYILDIYNYEIDRVHTRIFSFSTKLAKMEIVNVTWEIFSSEIFFLECFVYRKTLVKYETILHLKNC